MTKWLPWLGFDIEEVTEESVKVEFNPNRIDFSSHVGVARAYKGLRGWDIGLQNYNVKRGETLLNINKEVSSIRPYMLGAVVRDINLKDEDVVELMEVQEDIHWGIGRDRKKASVGVHNLDAVDPPFTFTAVEPKSIKFIPLDKIEEMTPDEILKGHEKGAAYSHLIDWAPKYPLLIDKSNTVLSMPPIINSETTRVDRETQNLFLDVTGTDFDAVENSLNVLATTLADMGGKIETVKATYTDREIHSPQLIPKKMKLRRPYVNDLLGLKLSTPEMIRCLEKCRLGAKKVSLTKIEVAIPPYRIDILHEVDLAEEVAIGYGYYKLKPTFPPSVTIGERHPLNKIATSTRRVMTGLGFTEVMNFTLTNEDLQYEKMRRRPGNAVRLANPVSAEYTMVRQELLPRLLQNLADNRHESFPQKLFEVSDVTRLNNELETGCERRLHVAAVSSHINANFSEIRSVTEALVTNIGFKHLKTKAEPHPTFIDGRFAAISVIDKQIGGVGEVHPEVLNSFDLENPVAAFEIDLEAL